MKPMIDPQDPGEKFERVQVWGTNEPDMFREFADWLEQERRRSNGDDIRPLQMVFSDEDPPYEGRWLLLTVLIERVAPAFRN